VTTTHCFYNQELPSDLGVLTRLHPVLQAWCHAGGLGIAATHRASVAVTEAITNAVIHVRPKRPNNTIHVALWITDGGLRAEVGDRGTWGWEAPPPPGADRWEQTGGRGLELIRQLSQTAVIEPRPGGGTLVKMTFVADDTERLAGEDAAGIRRASEGGRAMESRVESFDDVDVMRVSGRIDLVTSNNLKDSIRERLQRQRLNLVLNMERVDFINSSGLGALVSILKDVRIANGRLVLSNLAPYVQEIFEITQLSNVFEIFAKETQAISTLSRKVSTATA